MNEKANKALLKKFFFLIGGVLDVLILDFVTKVLVVRGIIGEFVFIEDVFYLTSYQRNEGIAFGIDMPRWLQIIGSFVILMLLVHLCFDYVVKSKHGTLFGSWMFGAVLGGGLGNFLDRIIHGYVVDFIVLKPFPVFNVADIGITVGLLVVFATIVLSSRRDEMETKN